MSRWDWRAIGTAALGILIWAAIIGSIVSNFLSSPSRALTDRDRFASKIMGTWNAFIDKHDIQLLSSGRAVLRIGGRKSYGAWRVAPPKITISLDGPAGSMHTDMQYRRLAEFDILYPSKTPLIDGCFWRVPDDQPEQD